MEGSVPLGTYASHVVLGKGTTLVKSHTTCQKHFFFDISLHVQTNMITVVFQRLLYLPNLTLLSPFLPTVLLVKTFFLLDNDEVDGVDGGGYNFEVDGDDGDDGGGPKI